MSVCEFVCVSKVWLVLKDLCEVVGSVVRYSLIGQLLQEAKHRNGQWVLGALDVFGLTDDGWKTHLGGCLLTEHIRQHVMLTVRSQ